MITILSSKGAPGATTAVAALTCGWPGPVVIADTDPTGGDLTVGWLGQWLVDGHFHRDHGVLSFVTSTRHESPAGPLAVGPHLQQVPVAAHARILAGLSNPAQQVSIGPSGWQRLASALAARAGQGCDVLVDAGRYGPTTPLPLLAAADLVLVAVRPRIRHALGAGPVLAGLRRLVEPARLGLAICAATPAGSRDIQRALGMTPGLQLPHDVATAAALSDGDDAGHPPRRTPLLVAAHHEATRLAAALNDTATECGHRDTPAEHQVPAAVGSGS
ncbi:hypothetical protein H0B56_17100 [Haloechinothrix sp. YIM 98757]|uniref:Cellulose biosynthesis protein BcsQ n=1 Tax=Haloechinothrix aidingensis TaxID=2752311 RepID=A0A838ADG4_9PSEU|nr:hypothetical protein [Haloechinothrix aidingensis]MBA0127270.1 hypothetical protein [Haloechinothrix aidingensis]